MKKLRKLMFTALIALLFTSCSCEQKMHRLTYKCPELFELKTIDVPIFIPAFRTDTTFVFSKGDTDTLHIVKERVVATIIRSHDTLKVYLTVPPDTVYKTIQVEVPKPIIERKNTFLEKIGKAFLFIITGAIICGVGYIIVKKKRLK